MISSSPTRGTIEQWFEALVDSSPTAVGIVSVVENRYVRVNSALVDFYGISREELLSLDPFSLAMRITHPDDLVAEQKLFGELATGARRSYTIEKRFVRPDGVVRWGLLTICAGLDAAAPTQPGAMVWATIHIVDITERRVAQETLALREAEFRHAQKIDALGRLAAGIAHDFNNLLTVITGHGEVLKDMAIQPNAMLSGRELAPDVEAILAAAERAAALTSQLLAHGRREAASPRSFVLSELAATMQRLLRRTLGMHVEVDQVLEAVGAIHADQSQVGQVLMNLMLNARDAVGQNGRIRLETRDLIVRAGAEQPNPPGPGEWVALIVSDNGHGMSAEVQAHIFEPFFTTRAERPGMQGNGLGLATVQRIVTEARGKIAIESTVGQGTTVTVYFPRVTPLATSAPPIASSSRRAAPNTRRVLVIEDDPSVRSLVSTVLVAAHYLVAVARDGEEGLHVLEAEPDSFHLIVTDLVMPRVGGMSLAKAVRARGNRARMLFISGYSEHSFAELMPYGQLLPKPFTPSQLLAAVERALAAEA